MAIHNVGGVRNGKHATVFLEKRSHKRETQTRRRLLRAQYVLYHTHGKLFRITLGDRRERAMALFRLQQLLGGRLFSCRGEQQLNIIIISDALTKYALFK